VRLKLHRAPHAFRAAGIGSLGEALLGMLSVAVQQAVASTGLGGLWLQTCDATKAAPDAGLARSL